MSRAKAGQGRAISEMLSFLESAEESVVQANTVTDIGQKELTSAQLRPATHRTWRRRVAWPSGRRRGQEEVGRHVRLVGSGR